MYTLASIVRKEINMNTNTINKKNIVAWIKAHKTNIIICTAYALYIALWIKVFTLLPTWLKRIIIVINVVHLVCTIVYYIIDNKKHKTTMDTLNSL